MFNEFTTEVITEVLTGLDNLITKNVEQSYWYAAFGDGHPRSTQLREVAEVLTRMKKVLEQELLERKILDTPAEETKKDDVQTPETTT